MNRVEYLLGKIAEECCEVGQRAIKAQRFGINEVQPGQELSNRRRLQLELADLEASIQMLEKETGESFSALAEDIYSHTYKVEQFMEYSERCGTLEKWNPEKEKQPKSI